VRQLLEGCRVEQMLKEDLDYDVDDDYHYMAL
jgi:hypothetical protein